MRQGCSQINKASFRLQTGSLHEKKGNAVKMIRHSMLIVSLTIWQIIMPSSHMQTMKMTFDILFPSTHFKSVLTTCMQIREAVSVLNQHKNSEEDYAIITDLMVGRIMHLEICVDRMLKDTATLHGEDVEYLAAVVDYMGSELADVFKAKPSERSNTMAMLISSIKIKLENVLGFPAELQNHLRHN